MNKKTTNALRKKYKFLSALEEINCGDGWKPLVTNMCKELNKVNLPADFCITQIAERFGELDVHTKDGTMQTRVIIDESNTLSIELCDECGKSRDLESCAKCTVPIVDYSDPEEDTDDEGDDTTCSTGCVPGSGGCGNCP